MCVLVNYSSCAWENQDRIYIRETSVKTELLKIPNSMVFKNVPLLPSIKMEVRLLYPLPALSAALGEAAALYRVCVIFLQL